MDYIYEKNFRTLCSNPFATFIANKYKGRPIDEIIDLIYEELILFESTYLLSGKLCMVYPNIKSQIALKDYPCYLSNDEIKKGTRYLRYDPFIIATNNPDNLKSYQSYKLNKIIICREFFEYYLPTNIGELDTFAYYTDNNYDDPSVNYGRLNRMIGEGLVLKPIKK